MKKIVLSIALFLFFQTGFAWNSEGHRVIAQIAYDHLTPIAKSTVDQLTASLFHSKYADDRFLEAATWPDDIKKETNRYNHWHYINLPDIQNSVIAPILNQHNVVWAITQSEEALENPTQFHRFSQSEYLSFLIHFIGDIHQPLHCITQYNNHFLPPLGDQGGNLYFIHDQFATNLHRFWDEGLGLFYAQNQHKINYFHVINIAKKFEQDYPPRFFKQKLLDDAPATWAHDSFELAKADAYAISENTTPTLSYIQQGQMISEEQATLAGYRLAKVLNKIFNR